MNKKYQILGFFFLLLIIFAACGSETAQQSESDADIGPEYGFVSKGLTIFSDGTMYYDTLYTTDNHWPSFPGGMPAFMDFLGSNIRYPESAIRDSLQGNVGLLLYIEANGSISNIEIVESGGYAFKDEVIGVIETMPAWKPANVKGKAVRSVFSLPVRFKLN